MLDPLEPPWVQRNPVSGRAPRAGPAAWGGTWGEPEPPSPGCGRGAVRQSPVRAGEGEGEHPPFHQFFYLLHLTYREF